MRTKKSYTLISLSLIGFLTLSLTACDGDADDCSDCQTFVDQGNSNYCANDPDFAPARICDSIGHGMYNYENCQCDCDTGWEGSDCNTLIQYNAGCTDPIIDTDDNLYNVVSIGTQCWMAKNLRVSSGITQVSDSLTWKNIYYNSLNTPAWCYYNNDSTTDNTYGKLYNWYAISGANICPDGWHIPTLADWQILIDFLGGENVAGGKLKSVSGWDSPNSDATNITNFSALPGGMRSGEGAFSLFGTQGVFWASDNTGNLSGTAIALKNINGIIYKWEGTAAKGEGHSCRCVKD